MDEHLRLGVIGGSGLYDMPGLEDVEEKKMATPFGAPSASVVVGNLGSKRVAFLARHGNGHHINPSEVNYRANVYALKSLGVNYLVSVSACGSLREDYQPGEIVVPDQLFDRTHLRARTFFDGGLVAHVGVAEPYCNPFSQQVAEACRSAGAIVHEGGAYITVEGPRFSTRAESNAYRSWGLSIIGMTSSPEAFLAREAEMHYAVMAHVTDYDVWHTEPVSVEMVVRTLQKNTTTAQEAVRLLASKLRGETGCDCDSALATAFISDPQKAPSAVKKKLGLLITKYL
jgi:5'-methylthioadenosine phosphorylase